MPESPLSDALRRLLAQPAEGRDGPIRLDVLVEEMFKRAVGGDRWALRELVSRLPAEEADELAARVARLAAAAEAPPTP